MADQHDDDAARGSVHLPDDATAASDTQPVELVPGQATNTASSTGATGASRTWRRRWTWLRMLIASNWAEHCTTCGSHSDSKDYLIDARGALPGRERALRSRPDAGRRRRRSP